MSETNNNPRGDLIRRSLMLQVKLIVDGVRDFLLVPVALVATLVGLLRSGEDPAREFDRVIELGRASDEWIDLFGMHQEANKAVPGSDQPRGQPGDQPRDQARDQPKTLEEWAGRAEEAIQKEIKSGELSEQAARALRSALRRSGPAPTGAKDKNPGQ